MSFRPPTLRSRAVRPRTDTHLACATPPLSTLGRLLLALGFALSLIVLVVVLFIVVLVVVVGALDRGNKLAGIFLVVIIVLGPLVTVDCGTSKGDVN